MSRYLAAYDIGDPRVRNIIATVLGRFGHRVQESVFELSLDPAEVSELRLALGVHLSKHDFSDLYPIDESGQRQHYRWQRPITRVPAVLLL